ncbi:MAG: AAA family ATPase [Thermoguttaceae bacterium]|nr:AAA family ATPase [Thermoguttaceae bacterium]
MKILAVRFFNLNSLRGRTEIRFDRGSLAQYGLFAITGPTGSGKSTILDAISVAMYGCTPRLDSSSIAQLMTKHTCECWSEVEFEVADQQYCSRFELKRARKQVHGKIQPSKMELRRLNTNPDPLGGKESEEPLDCKSKKEVLEQIVRLTGLDFSRFRQSVILAQGEFASFLKADKNKRAELLERITGTEIYRRISIYVFEKSKEIQQEYEKKSAVLAQIEAPSEEALQGLAQQKSEMENELKQLEMDCQQAEIKRDAMEKWMDAEEQYRIASVHLSTSEKAKEAAVELFEKRRLASKASDFLPQCTELREEMTSQKKRLESQELLRSEINAIVSQCNTIATQRENAQKELIRWTEEYRDQKLILEEASKNELQITNLQEQSHATRDDLDHIEQNFSCQIALQSQGNQTLQAFQAENLRLREYLASHTSLHLLSQSMSLLMDKQRQFEQFDVQVMELQEKLNFSRQTCDQLAESIKKSAFEVDQATSDVGEKHQGYEILFQKMKKCYPDGYEMISEQINTQIKQIQKRRETATRQLEHLEKIFQLQKEQTSIETDIQRESEEQQTQCKESQRLSELVSQQKKVVELLRLVQDLSSFRKDLIYGKPCPLCGSDIHPYIDNQIYQKTDLEDCSEFHLEDEKWVLMQNDLRSLDQSIAMREGIIRGKMSQLNTIHERLAECSNHWKNEFHELPMTEDQADELRSLLQILLVEYQTNLENNEQLNILQRQIHEAEKIWQSSVNQLNEFEKVLTELRHQYDIEKKGCDYLHESVQKSISERKDVYQAWVYLLTESHTAIPPLGKEKPFLSQLESEILDYQAKVKSQDEVQKKIVELTIRLEGVERLIQELTTRREALHQKEHEEIETLSKLQVELRSQIGDSPSVSHARHALEIQDQAIRQTLINLEKQYESVNSVRMTQEKTFRNIKDEIQKAEEKIRQDQLRLNEQIIASGFQNRDAFEASILTSEEREILDKKCADLESDLTTQRAYFQAREQILKKSQEALHTLNITCSSDENETKKQYEQINSSVQKYIQCKNEHLTRLGEISQQYTQALDLRAKSCQMNESLSECQKERERWNLLSKLIGAADGATFQRFAQGLTFRHLISKANQRLVELSSRYTLGYSTEKELDFEVIDHYQADTRRPTSTLSGGETFLISLSLALALSEMAGSTSRPESLFLDEGFGTLDIHTLEMVLQVLDRLQNSGRLIGIISHVDAFQERIPVRICVEPRGNGISAVRIPSND